MLLRILRLVGASLLVFLSSIAIGEEIYGTLPDTIHSEQRYAFYAHGLIVEGENPRPVHAEYGVYEFPEIVDSLFAIGGFNLIAHHRPANTDIEDYVATYASWVTALLDAGVPESSITLIGFSRGSHLTALTADQFSDLKINTVLMAGCFNGDMAFNPPIKLGGRFLSIYETTDGAGSCERLAERSTLDSFHEFAITTGKKHGAFYTPLEDWISPIANWIH